MMFSSTEHRHTDIFFRDVLIVATTQSEKLSMVEAFSLKIYLKDVK